MQREMSIGDAIYITIAIHSPLSHLFVYSIYPRQVIGMPIHLTTQSHECSRHLYKRAKPTLLLLCVGCLPVSKGGDHAAAEDDAIQLASLGFPESPFSLSNAVWSFPSIEHLLNTVL
jgi:hypothetical protein